MHPVLRALQGMWAPSSKPPPITGQVPRATWWGQPAAFATANAYLVDETYDVGPPPQDGSDYGFIRLGDGGPDLVARQQNKVPSGTRLPAPVSAFFPFEHMGHDVHPELTPFFAVRQNQTKVIALAPLESVSPNPREFDVATHLRWAANGPPLDIAPQVPSGPSM